MKKTLSGLSLAMLLATGQAFADNATLAALQSAQIPLNDQEIAALAAAEGETLADLIATLAARYPEHALALINTSVKANASKPAVVTLITQKTANTARLPDQGTTNPGAATLQALQNANIPLTPDQATAVANATSDTLPGIVSNLAAANPAYAASIVNTASSANSDNPSLSTQIVQSNGAIANASNQGANATAMKNRHKGGEPTASPN